MTSFQDLPEEVNTLILQNLPDSTLLDNFSTCLDWSFWKVLASIRFQVPGEYFDLALERKILPSERYLEILSKFRATPQALAKFENGKLKGIWTPEQLAHQAYLEKNFTLMGQMMDLAGNEFLPIENPQRIDNSNDIMGLYSESLVTRKFDIVNRLAPLITLKGLPGPNPEGWVGGIPPRTCSNFRGFIPNFEDRLASLAYSHENFDILQAYFVDLPWEYQSCLIRSVIQSGRQKEAEILMSYHSDYWNTFRPEDNDLSCVEDSPGKFSLEMQHLPFEDYSRNPLIDAYVGANLNLINKFEAIGWSLRPLHAIEMLLDGYEDRLSNPIDVYNVIVTKFKKIPEGSQVFFFGCADIDLFQLAHRQLEPVDLEMEFWRMRKSRNNINFTKYILEFYSKLVDIRDPKYMRKILDWTSLSKIELEYMTGVVESI